MLLSSISITFGKGVLDHNTRKFTAENVDKSRTKFNVEYENKSLEEAYHILFDEPLKIYNEKQKRNDRKINNYLEHIKKGNQEKTFYEIVVQIGNMKDFGVNMRTAEIAKTILDEYMKSFQERNPYLYVFSAHLHLDESAPHLHIDFVPYTTNSKRGLDTRVSLKKALSNQGFEGTGRGDTETMLWIQSEKEALANVMYRNDVEWEQQGNNNKHLSVTEFKKQQRVKECNELENRVTELKEDIDAFTEGKQIIEELSSIEEFDEMFELPEPDRFMSAKTYKTKIVQPIIDKMKSFVKGLIVKYLETRQELNYANRQVKDLSWDNYHLKESNRNYQKHNQKLYKENSSYRLLRKLLGKKQIDQLIDQAKQRKSKEREL